MSSDCDTKQTQNVPVASSNSPCSGKYGPTLHVKVLDACNADCGFCIEHEGRTADNAVPASELVLRINANPGQNIMLVGGEPTIHQLEFTTNELLSLIDEKIVTGLKENADCLKTAQAQMQSAKDSLDFFNRAKKNFKKNKDLIRYKGYVK